MYFEIIKIVCSMLTAAMSAYLGFYFACKKEDRTLKLIIRSRIELLQRKIPGASKDDVIDIHRNSVEKIGEDVTRAMAVLGKQGQIDASRAWANYKDLCLEACAEEIFDAEIATVIHSEGYGNRSAEKRTTAPEVFARALLELKATFE